MSKVTFPVTSSFNQAQASFARHGGDLRVKRPAHKAFTAAFGWVERDELDSPKAARKIVKINIVMAVAEARATELGLTFNAVTAFDTQSQTFTLAVTDADGNARRGNLALKRVTAVFKAIEPTAAELAEAELDADSIDF